MFLHKLAQKVFSGIKKKNSTNTYQDVVTWLNDGTTPNKPEGTTSVDNWGSFRDICTKKIQSEFGSRHHLTDFVIQDQKSRLCFLGAKPQSRDRYTYPGILSYWHDTWYEDTVGLYFELWNRTNFSLWKSFYNGHLEPKLVSEDSNLINLEQKMKKWYKTAKVGTTENLGSNPTIEEFLSGNWSPDYVK